MKPGQRGSSAISSLREAAEKKRRETIEKIERGKEKALRFIEENDGIYPHNGGRLNQAEVCRLSGVDPTILGGKAHKDSTREDLNEWIRNLDQLPRGKRRFRKAVNGQVQAWKSLYEEALDSFAIVELELAETRQQLAECQAELNALRERLS